MDIIRFKISYFKGTLNTGFIKPAAHFLHALHNDGDITGLQFGSQTAAGGVAVSPTRSLCHSWVPLGSTGLFSPSGIIFF